MLSEKFQYLNILCLKFKNPEILSEKFQNPKMSEQGLNPNMSEKFQNPSVLSPRVRKHKRLSEKIQNPNILSENCQNPICLRNNPNILSNKVKRPKTLSREGKPPNMLSEECYKRNTCFTRLTTIKYCQRGSEPSTFLSNSVTAMVPLTSPTFIRSSINFSSLIQKQM